MTGGVTFEDVCEAIRTLGKYAEESDNFPGHDELAELLSPDVLLSIADGIYAFEQEIDHKTSL